MEEERKKRETFLCLVKKENKRKGEWEEKVFCGVHYFIGRKKALVLYLVATCFIVSYYILTRVSFCHLLIDLQIGMGQ